MTSGPDSGGLELHPSYATASSLHITFVDLTDNDFLHFAISDIPLNRLEEICDDAYAQQEMARSHDITLDDDDRFSYSLGLNTGAKQLDDVHGVLMAGEEEDVIQIELLEPTSETLIDDAGVPLDQSVEIGRDAQDFDADYPLPPIDIDYDDKDAERNRCSPLLPGTSKSRTR